MDVVWPKSPKSREFAASGPTAANVGLQQQQRQVKSRFVVMKPKLNDQIKTYFTLKGHSHINGRFVVGLERVTSFELRASSDSLGFAPY